MFIFFKYIQPIHYFLLKNKNKTSIFPVINELPETIIKQLEIDNSYKSKEARNYDLSWQAIQKGYIGNAQKIENLEKIPLEDEYRFTRKYFHPIWVTYTLLIRIITLNNPFKELYGWLKSKGKIRSDYLNSPIKYSNWKTFDSELIRQNKKVSVIIPTLNRYKYLKDVLTDLEKQAYKNFDIIIIDQSEPFKKEFYSQFKLDIKLIHQEEKALWLARNRAVKMSDANYLLLFDDDSRVEKDWIVNHIKCLDFFNADISSGVSISLVGAEVPAHYSFFRISDQIDTGNVLIKKEVFKKIGLFDRQFEKQRMGDGEFGLRAYLEGFVNVSNPYAKRLHLKVDTGGLRQMGSWDAFRPKNWFGPRPIPSVLYFFRKYYGNKQAILSIIKTVPPSLVHYKYKKSKTIKFFTYISMVFFWPLILYQVVRSWRLATIKLTEGSLIEKL
ncbi:MAG: glycosyltransferase family 2 protein [Flavobacteriaceae bacterium]|nr:glycosyltransferase family 2 protein [Flavobacteriaceae bacterium]